MEKQPLTIFWTEPAKIRLESGLDIKLRLILINLTGLKLWSLIEVFAAKPNLTYDDLHFLK